MKTVCVIPARYASQRLPGKPLIKILGRPLISWVIMRARKLDFVEELLVATDDSRIASVAEAEGVEAVMTAPELPSGTDRIRAALEGRAADIVINLQGDEAGMPMEAVRMAYEALVEAHADVSTACVPITKREDFESPNIVKVVRGGGGRALYFSRSPIPSAARRHLEEVSEPGFVWGHKHLGLYLYRRPALERACSLPPSRLELVEKLEQLRMLEAGMSIVCVDSPHDSVGVDVADDLGRAEALLRCEGFSE